MHTQGAKVPKEQNFNGCVGYDFVSQCILSSVAAVLISSKVQLNKPEHASCRRQKLTDQSHMFSKYYIKSI